jgi:nucleotide-binding universal stress UspA family protein
MKRGFSFRRIVAPLDGSLIAEQSLKFAMSMATIESASILLLFVVSPESSRKPGAMESPIGPASPREVEAAQYYLDSIIARLGKGLSISSKVVISSDVAGAILEVASADEADLVAIATHGRGAIARARSGSVSDRVMRESAVSTLVVHPMLGSANRASPVTALKGVIL